MSHILRWWPSDPNNRGWNEKLSERAFDFITRERPAMSLLQNVGIQTADYIRRRTEFETYAYKSGNDSFRGRIQDRMRRDENQKRGPDHSHINEFAEQIEIIRAIHMVEK